jgi:hypothetical protein
MKTVSNFKKSLICFVVGFIFLYPRVNNILFGNGFVKGELFSYQAGWCFGWLISICFIILGFYFLIKKDK